MNQYDYLRNKLHEYEVKTDKEKIWQQTAHAIPQRRKRRMLLFFFAGLVLIAGLVGYTLSSDKSTTFIATNDNQINQGFVNENLIDNKQEGKMADADINTNENTNIHSSVASVPEINNTSVPSGMEKPQKTKPILSAEASDHPKSPIKTKEPVQTDNPRNQVAEIPVIVASELDEKQLVRPLQSITPSPDQLMTEPRDYTVTDSPNYMSAGSDQQPISGSPDHRIITLMSPTDSLETLPLMPLAFDTDASVQTSTPILSANKSGSKISWEVISGIGLSTLNITASNEASKEMQELMRKSVRGLEHLSLDVSGSLPLGHDFSVAAGIGWNQWTTETQQATTTTQSFTKEGVTNIIIDQNGVQHPVMGTVSGVQFIHKNRIRYTQHQSIAAGISLQKTIWRKNRFAVDAFAKGNYVISDFATGSAYNGEGSLERFAKAENPFKRNSRFDAGGGLMLQFQITRHLGISSTIGYHPINYHWLQNQLEIEWTHSRVHGNLGLRYQLN